MGDFGYCIVKATTKPAFDPEDVLQPNLEKLLKLVSGNIKATEVINRLMPFNKPVPSGPVNFSKSNESNLEENKINDQLVYN